MNKQFVLMQNSILPKNGVFLISDDLCFDVNEGVSRIEDGLLLADKAQIQFNGYLNLIPISHWIRYLDGLECVRVEIQAIGCGVVSLYGYVNGLTVVVASLEMNEWVGEHMLEVTLNKLEMYDALFIGVESLHGEVQVFGCRVYTQVRMRPVSLAVIFCTYQRPTEVTRNVHACLNAICDYPQLTELRIVVVNNDADDGGMLKLTPNPHLTILPNKNLGGAGGFTKGMIYAKDKGFSHVLLCDDDAVIHPEILFRTTQLLTSMSDPDRGIHGAMLELERPSCVHEIGERFDVHRHLHLQFHDGRMVNDKTVALAALMDSLISSEEANLFGWWYTAIPMNVVQKVGLPAPFFVSGDDIEYSIRLVKHGYSALILPSVSIWHPSHIRSVSAERLFFTHRNRLIMTSIHSNWVAVSRFYYKTLGEAWQLRRQQKWRESLALLLVLKDYIFAENWDRMTMSILCSRLNAYCKCSQIRWLLRWARSVCFLGGAILYSKKKYQRTFEYIVSQGHWLNKF